MARLPAWQPLQNSQRATYPLWHGDGGATIGHWGHLNYWTGTARNRTSSTNGKTLVKVPDGGRQAAFSQRLLDDVEPQQAVVFAERDDRYRDLAAGVEAAWKAQVGAEGWHRADLEGTVSFVSDGKRIVLTA